MVIFRREGGIYHLAASHGYTTDYREWMQRQSIAISRQTLVGRTAAEGHTVHIPDALNDAEYTWTESVKRAGHRTMLGVPLLNVSTDGEVSVMDAPLHYSIAPRTPGSCAHSKCRFGRGAIQSDFSLGAPMNFADMARFPVESYGEIKRWHARLRALPA